MIKADDKGVPKALIDEFMPRIIFRALRDEKIIVKECLNIMSKVMQRMEVKHLYLLVS